MQNKFNAVLMLTIFTHCHSPLFAMDESIKKQIENARQQLVQALIAHRPCYRCRNGVACEQDLQSSDLFNQQVADIALNAGNLISNEEKLNYLYGDHRFAERKKIIKQMIEKDKTHPNAIRYQDNKTPLNESALHKDHDFACYLLRHGATFDRKTIKERAEFIALFGAVEKNQDQ